MRLVLGLAALSAIALTAVACIDDLAAPTACPAEPKHAGKSCADAITDPPLGCMSYDFAAKVETPERVECLTGPRATCRCTSKDCPPKAGACNPDGDCPKAVRDEAPEASCKRLLPEAVGADLPTDSMCMCMCAGCAAVCDGVGPVIGVSTEKDVQPAPVLFEFGDRMPASGRLGLYMRIRGLANTRVVLFKGPTAKLDELQVIPDPSYVTLNELGNEFVEQILFSDEFLGVHAYTWKTAADKPTAAAVFPTIDQDGPGLALFELDCLVPFVVPL